MKQYGFLIDLSRCTGCNACVVACKQWHGIDPGPVKWMRVYQWEKGSFPEIDLRVMPLMCFHCGTPHCAEACPNEAIYKEETYGAVLVDPKKCTGLRKCWEACPYGTPQFKGDGPGEKMSKCNMCIDRLKDGLNPICVQSCSLRALEFGPLDELKQKYDDRKSLHEKTANSGAPCRIACPAGVDVQGYVELIARGKFKEALALFRETTPFAGVLGRVCNHPCEIDCLRGRFDDAVSICSLKRFIADREMDTGRTEVPPAQIDKKEKIAVIGSGPAGLTCAYDLARFGYPVTVFESAPRGGGFLRYGIPEYRLPEEVLDNDIRYIEESGVEIKLDARVNQIDDLFTRGYAAVFVATGAWDSVKLGAEGEDAEGVLYAVDFLNRVNSKEDVKTGRHVVVVGGGSVAMDAGRIALRLGSEAVHLVCMESLDLQSKDRLLAQDAEIEDARKEGIVIHPSLGIERFNTKGGKVTGITAINCLSVRDEDGAFNPKLDEKSTPTTIDADMVIIAIGQDIAPSMLPEGLEKTRIGSLGVDPITLQTSDSRVFAGGDAATGPLDMISAIASGKQAAISLDRFIRGEDLERDRHLPSESLRKHVEKKSLKPPVLDLRHRKDFVEVALGFDKDAALEQAGKCLRCGTLSPSVVIKREDPKRQVVPWDAERALLLWQKRHPENGEVLPDIFTDVSDVTRAPEPEIMGRNKLVLKAKSLEELMFYTTDDE